MANILFAWELGGNLGHFAMLLPIAQELRRQGHGVMFALKDLSVLAHSEGGFDFPVLQSPRWLPRLNNSADAVAYSDILMGAGYLSAHGLKAVVAAWRALFQLTRADVVVCEHAPTALLAARIDKRRAICIGTGFSCPPAQPPLPRFIPLNRPHQMQLQAREQKMLNACNAVLTQQGSALLADLAELFADAQPLLCTYAELDHYGERPAANYFGAIYTDVASSSVVWPQIYARNILVYVNNFVYWARQIAALRAVQANIVIAAVGLPKQWLGAAQPPHIAVIAAPIALQAALADADLVICHGGHGTVAAALAAGKPLLLWPTQKEQGLLALRIAAQRLGMFCDVHAATVPLMTEQIDKALNEQALRSNAQVFAQKYRDNSVAASACAAANQIAKAAHGE